MSALYYLHYGSWNIEQMQPLMKYSVYIMSLGEFVTLYFILPLG